MSSVLLPYSDSALGFGCAKVKSYLLFQMNVPLSIAVFSLFCVVLGADSENARLLASKTILNQYLVEDKDLTIQYDIYNVGAR